MNLTVFTAAQSAKHLREALIAAAEFTPQEHALPVAGGGTVRWTDVVALAINNHTHAFPMVVNGAACFVMQVHDRGYTIGPCIDKADPLSENIWFETPEELELWLMAVGTYED